MVQCAYKGLTGIILDRLPDENFIKSFTPQDLHEITDYYALQKYYKIPNEGVATAFWGLDLIDYTFSLNLKNNQSIPLSFKKENGLFVPSIVTCDGQSSSESLTDDEKRKAAMREILVQSLVYVPEKSQGNYFMLTSFGGCCPFHGGVIRTTQKEIEKIL